MILIGIAGKKRTGKDTVAGIITKLCKCPARIIGFADPLKDEVAHGCKVGVSYIEKHKTQFRPVLQWWGTDFRRKLCSEDYWVKQITDWIEKDLSKTCDLVVIKDIRFLNEAEFIQQQGGHLIRMERTVNGNQADSHISETDLDHFQFNYTIDNNGTMEELVQKTFSILKQINQQIKQNV